MLLKILLMALIVYVIVVTRARVRLPHPGLQATVDVLQAATLRDEHVVATAGSSSTPTRSSRLFPQAIRMPNGSSG